MPAIAVTGDSGSGKSTSYIPNKEIPIKGLHPRETVIINVSKKPLPGRKTDKFYNLSTGVNGKTKDEKILDIADQINNQKIRQFRTDNPARIVTILRTIDKFCPQILNIVTDDSQYMQGLMVMRRLQEQGWGKYNDVAEAGFGPVDAAMNLKRQDLMVFFLYHADISEKTGDRKIKTAGKAVDQYITMDGLFTVNLYTEVDFDGVKGRTRYSFRTNTRGGDSCKSPFGMFDELLIPNDLGYVRDKYLEYYE